jgi:RNA polymerase sigma factor (sigma-70 family)
VQPFDGIARLTSVHRETAPCLKGDSTSQRRDLETLYRAHWSRLVRIAWLTVASRDEAEDIVQSAFLRFDQATAQIDDPFAYLRRIVVNLAIDEHRRIAVARRYRPTPALSVLNPETEEVWASVQTLPVRQRQALVLRFHADLTFEQIAEDMGCPVGTVKSLVHRGLATLRGAIDR